MRSKAARARFLTTGGAAPDLGVGQPPSDSDVLGPVVPADRLTVTLSVGSSRAGHLFTAYQQDVRRQFKTGQKQLINESLVDYVQPSGAGYFFTLTGVLDTSDWYGQATLS
jgi:hypothetical protein